MKTAAVTPPLSPARRRLLQQGGVLSALSALDLATQRLLAATPQAPRRAPSIFVGHGSPMNAIQDNAFSRRLRAWGQALMQAGPPVAVLSISAHWLTPGEVRVDAQMKPRTIHDFGGFPRELHEMQYPAPGSPVLAAAVAEALSRHGARTSMDWGLDHGTWTVLHHIFPTAQIPVLQLSIDYAQGADFHYGVGQRLARLRERGVLIMGSGNIVHNLRATVRGAAEAERAATPWAQSFDDLAQQALSARDDKALMAYERLGPGAAMAVPTPDHYWPLMYALGAADPKEKPKAVYASFQAGTLSMRCLQWG